MRLRFPTHLDSFPNVNKISYSVDGDDGEIWSVDGGELSWAECGVGKVVWHSETCAGKLREADWVHVHVTTHSNLGIVEKSKKKREFSFYFGGNRLYESCYLKSKVHCFWVFFVSRK